MQFHLLGANSFYWFEISFCVKTMSNAVHQLEYVFKTVVKHQYSDAGAWHLTVARNWTLIAVEFLRASTPAPKF